MPRYRWIAPLALSALFACRALAEPDAAPLPIAVPPSDPRIHYSARLDRRNPDAPRFDWPGSAILVRFEGTTLNATFATSGADRLQVVIDGEPTRVLALTRKPQLYALASGLTKGEHTVDIFKRTESFFGCTTFFGLQLEEGAKLIEAPVAGRRIEFIGDSITVGYGNEAANGNESLTPANENNCLAWSSLTARQLHAECLVLAVSGSRLTELPGDDGMPTFYRRTLFLDRTLPWDFKAAPAPDAVVINLGTNDFYQGFPSEKTWAAAYDQLLDFVRANYPKAHVWLATGSMALSEEKMAAWRRGNAAILERRRAVGDTRLHTLDFDLQQPEDGVGANEHPSLKTHRKMADRLAAEVRRVLGW